MMNYIWGFLILCGFGAFALSGDPAASVDAMLSGVSEALELCLALCPSFMLWLGLMNVAREAGLMEKLSRAARPLLKRLMPDSPGAMAPITLNLAANFLGLGSAATPFGIEAMAELQKANRLGQCRKRRYVHVHRPEFLRRGAAAHKRTGIARRRGLHRSVLRGAAYVYCVARIRLLRGAAVPAA